MKNRNKITVAIIIVILLLIVCAVLFALSGNQAENPSPSTGNTSGTEDSTSSGGTTTAPTNPNKAPTEPEPTVPTETVTEPTCTTDGYTTYTCSRCDSSYSDNFVPATGHSYTAEVTSEATCTADGIKTYTCSNCGDRYTERIPMLDHDYQSKVTTEPTCTQKGVRTYTCSCGKSYTEAIEKTDHTYVDTVTPPTCTEDGYTTYTCVDCGKSEVKDIVPATGHVNTTETRVEPTCMVDGSVTVICNDCGATVSVTVLDATGDCSYTKKMSLDKAAQEAYENGIPYYLSYSGFEDYDVYVCSVCGDIDIDTMTFRYSDYEAAAIMLGYVNDLRKSVGVEPLELDTTLIEKAKVQAEKYRDTGSISGIGFTFNAVDGGHSIKHQFEKWSNGNGYANMVKSSFKYFGYAVCRDPDGGSNSLYGVQLFWNGK